jgi:hypothetical protein
MERGTSAGELELIAANFAGGHQGAIATAAPDQATLAATQELTGSMVIDHK